VRSARVQKILASPGFDPRTVQPVARPSAIYWPTVLWMVLGDGRSVDLPLASSPSVGSLSDRTRGRGCSFVPPFWSPFDDRMGLCVVVFIIYSESCLKRNLNVTKTRP
jgi:hypothetical protein